MANRRMISKSLSTSNRFSEVSDFAALLFVLLVPHCDDGGNMDARPRTVKAIVVPMREQTPEDVASAITELKNAGLITLYKAKNGTLGEEEFLHINKWEDHQTLRLDRLDLRYPPFGQPPGNRSATARQLKRREEKRSKEKRSKEKRREGNVRAAANDLLTYWNKLRGTSYGSIRSIESNVEYWLEEYTVEQMKKAIEIVPKHHYWAGIMGPEIFFRRMNPSRQPVDYIGEMLNYKPRAAQQPQGSFK